MKNLTNLLLHGADHAGSVAALCRALNTTPRGLRAMISDARAAGQEILYAPGGRGGYFLPSTDPAQAQQERLAFYKTMRGRALCALHALRPVAAALGRPLGQLDIFEDGATDGTDEKKS